MPNPFPGMNPYLEKTSIWQGFHNSLAAHIADELNSLLPSNYVATTELRIFMEDLVFGQARPDVVIVDNTASPPSPISAELPYFPQAFSPQPAGSLAFLSTRTTTPCASPLARRRC